jgi:hypothetical protein
MVHSRATLVGLVLATSSGCGPEDAASTATTVTVPAGAGPASPGSAGPGSAGPGGAGAGGRGSGIAVSGSDGGGAGIGLAGAADSAGASVDSTGGGGSDAGAPDESGPPPCLEFSVPVVAGTIELAELDQLSGFVASRARDGVLFAHEDSTGAPIVYALDTTGRSLAAFTLEGAPNLDWEDIALGPGPGGATHLFIGDIGDNAIRTGGAPRAELAVIRLPEPEVALAQAFVEQTLSNFDVLRFTYPTGVHEAETLMVHPGTGDLLIVTRSTVGDSHVYRAPGSTPPDTPTVLDEIGQIAFDPSGQGALATAGDISPTGDRVIVRTYTNVYLWPAPSGMALDAVFRGTPVILPSAVEPQGEAISFVADGHAWLSGSEQSRAIYRSDEACPE